MGQLVDTVKQKLPRHEGAIRAQQEPLAIVIGIMGPL